MCACVNVCVREELERRLQLGERALDSLSEKKRKRLASKNEKAEKKNDLGKEALGRLQKAVNKLNRMTRPGKTIDDEKEKYRLLEDEISHDQQQLTQDHFDLHFSNFRVLYLCCQS